MMLCLEVLGRIPLKIRARRVNMIYLKSTHSIVTFEMLFKIDSVIKLSSILEKVTASNLLRILKACFIVLLLTRKVCFNIEIWITLSSVFSLAGSAWELDKFLLTVFKVLPCNEGFFGYLIFPIIARMFCRKHLNISFDGIESEN